MPGFTALRLDMVEEPAIVKIHPQVGVPEIPPLCTRGRVASNVQCAALVIRHPTGCGPPLGGAGKVRGRLILMNDLPVQVPMTGKIR